MEEMRLQKFLANAGVASRRKSEELIVEGKIQVNGKQVIELGFKVNPDVDKVEYMGNIIKPLGDKHTYILLNKPIGYITTVSDQFNRDTVMDLVKDVHVNLLPVGRLDMYTSGALIMTDDGDLIYKVTHPKNEIEKTYNVTVIGIVTSEDVEKLRQGVEIEDYVSGKAKVKILKTDEVKNQSRLQITIHEGKNREVRKMCEAIGKRVLALHRCRIGNIEVKDVKLGTWRYLKDREVEDLIKKCK